MMNECGERVLQGDFSNNILFGVINKYYKMYNLPINEINEIIIALKINNACT